MSIVKFNNKVLRLNNKTVGWTAPVPPPVLYHVTTNGVNGTVVATPNTGYNGDTITLSNTPDAGYEFDSYSLTGATLYDTNKFDINNSDVNVVGNFIVAPEPVSINIERNMSYNYIGWYNSDAIAAGATYNSTYKIVSNSWPAGLDHFYFEFWDANWALYFTGNYVYASDNYKFNLSNILTQTQYNNLKYISIYPKDSNDNTLDLPYWDIELQLLS